jgi:hypothetical protein
MDYMKFNIIVSDPLLDFSDPLCMSDINRLAKANYNIMTFCEYVEKNSFIKC